VPDKGVSDGKIRLGGSGRGDTVEGGGDMAQDVKQSVVGHGRLFGHNDGPLKDAP
jgi:hypothetical protein